MSSSSTRASHRQWADRPVPRFATNTSTLRTDGYGDVVRRAQACGIDPVEAVVPPARD